MALLQLEERKESKNCAAAAYLDHGVHVLTWQLPADDVIGCANLALQLLRCLAKEELRLQLHHDRHIAARQQSLRPMHSLVMRHKSHGHP